MGELRPSLPPSGVGAARLGGGKGERTGRGDVGASGDALSGVAVLFITTTTTWRFIGAWGGGRPAWFRWLYLIIYEFIMLTRIDSRTSILSSSQLYSLASWKYEYIQCMRAVLAYNLYDIPAARIYEYAIIESTWYRRRGAEDLPGTSVR